LCDPVTKIQGTIVVMARRKLSMWTCPALVPTQVLV
jgi:hypothetical protein